MENIGHLCEWKINGEENPLREKKDKDEDNFAGRASIHGTIQWQISLSAVIIWYTIIISTILKKLVRSICSKINSLQ